MAAGRVGLIAARVPAASKLGRVGQLSVRIPTAAFTGRVGYIAAHTNATSVAVTCWDGSNLRPVKVYVCTGLNPSTFAEVVA